MSVEALIREAPSPRDRVIAGLIALRLTFDSGVATRLVRRLQGFVYEACAGEALYGMPLWLADQSHVEALIDASDCRLRDAIAEIQQLLDRALVEQAQGHLAMPVDGSLTRDREHAAKLIRSCQPVPRDEGWRLLRTDVPLLVESGRLADHDTRAVLLGLQVEPIAPTPLCRSDGILMDTGTMDEDFVAGVRDGRDAAMALLRSLGAPDELVDCLRTLYVRPLGVEGMDVGTELLVGRSAGLPVALALLQRASEFEGHPLPQSEHVATGCFRIDGAGTLDGISHGAALAKLEAVITDGLRGRLMCPFPTDDETDEPLRRDRLNRSLSIVNDLREAATVMWGDAWCEWHRRLTRAIVRSNLPGPTYSAYVSQPKIERRAEEGLRSRLPIVVLDGPGGAGKSTIARELAGRIVATGGAGYDAVVWVSDRAQPGSTRLEGVLGTVARVLGYKADPEQDDELHGVLSNHPVLLVIDNFETVRDRRVSEWLTRLPEGSKAIITTRVGRRPVTPPEYCFPVRVDGLETREEFVEQCLLRLELEDVAADVIESVLASTGSVPKAIELAFGYLKSSPIDHTVKVEGLRRVSGRLFAELVQWNFELLECPERWLLLASEFYPYGATLEELGAVADVTREEAAVALRRLLDSGLIDMERVREHDAGLLFSHPVSRDFIADRLREEAAFHREARRRWIERQVRCAEGVGYCPGDVERLRALDRPGARETLVYAADVALEAGMYDAAVAIARGARYYFYVRGYWTSNRSPYLIWANASHAQGDPCEEYDALTYQANILSKQGSPGAVEQLIPRLQEIERTCEIPVASRRKSRHAEALYLLAKGQYREAAAIWTEHLAVIPRDHEDYSPTARWFAVCHQRAGRADEARALARHGLEHAREFGLPRAIAATMLHLTELDLAEDDLAAVDQRLRDLEPLIARLNDLAYSADFAYFKGLSAARSGDGTIAALHLSDARERYARLGLRRRVSEATEELRRIEALT